MHNMYILHVLKGLMDVSMISLTNKYSRAYHLEQNIPFDGIKVSLPEVYYRIARTGFLKNGLRAWQDWRTSLIMAKMLEEFSPDIIEFIDIHSNGYAYLRRNLRWKRQAKVIVRSHTPWGLLRTSYSTDEIKNTLQIPSFWGSLI